ncbi:alkaline phosphatase [Methanocaldococcus indicus]|uniref:alkaline phosphatase n=1 Tax=Methanocaldococcus indicus TaxID=213231 RepID=UPI003C6D62FE
MKKIGIVAVFVMILLSVFTAGCVGNQSNSKVEINEMPAKSIEAKSAENNIPKAKSVIIFIGDGMGINQVYLANRYSEEVYGKNLTFPYVTNNTGLMTTYSLGHDVTDSAAAAVAMFSGYKTKNRMVNMLPDGKIPKKILSEIFKEEGKSVGIITTTRITHATPAAMYAHVKDRGEEDKIAEQLLEFEPDVALGGGLEYFIPKDEKGSKRKDNKNLIEEFKKKGYTIVYNKEELEKVNPENTKKLLGLFSMSHMAYEIDRENIPEYQNQPSLAEMTKKALEILDKNPNGFILMVEGGRIDHGYHTHDIKAAVVDVKAFDDAIKVALDYQKKHPDTLIVITADHETGGLSIGRGTCSYADSSSGAVSYKENVSAVKNVKCSVKYLVKRILADNLSKDETVKFIEKMWGTKLTDKEKELLFKYPLDSKITDKVILSYYPRVNEYLDNWGEYALSKIESDRSRVYWTAYGHTQNPVAVWAIGPGEELFRGFYDNTDIYTKILEASEGNYTHIPCSSCVDSALLIAAVN